MIVAVVVGLVALAANCRLCNNRGWRTVEVTCSVCGGRGYIDTYRGQKPCSVCRPRRGLSKSTDYGTGRVFVRQSCPCRGIFLSADDLRVICGGGTTLVNGVWISCSNTVEKVGHL